MKKLNQKLKRYKKLFIIPFVISFVFISCDKEHSSELPNIEWESVQQFSETNVEDIAIDGNSTYIIFNPGFSDSARIYKTTDDKEWSEVKASIYYPEDDNSSTYFGNISSISVNKGSIFIGTSDSKIFVQAPEDTAFNRVLNNFGDDITNFYFHRNGIFATALRDGLYQSKDGGETWESILNNQVNFDSHVEVSSIAFNSKDKAFVGTMNLWGETSDKSYILSSQAPFQNWNVLRSGTSGFDYIDCLAIDNSDNIFAGLLFGGIIYSFDNGQTWSKPDTSSFRAVTDLIINRAGHIYASTVTRNSNSNSQTQAIFRLQRINSNWENVGIENFGIINDIEISGTGILYVATRNGLYKTANSTVLQNH